MEAVSEDVFQEASAEFIGRWNHLVSTTNWEKGQIISLWRAELVKEGAGVADYSDDAWAQRVGGVSSQHVGRLRRVHDRFGESYEQYDSLFWSHFQAAIEWEDAEMWLEGAVQNRWSVSKMRLNRHETIGADESLKPRDEDIITGELDEDVDASLGGEPSSADRESENVEPTYSEVQDPDDSSNSATADLGELPAASMVDDEADSSERVRPFADLPDLPEDLAESFEEVKLAIVRHRLAGWEEVASNEVAAHLDALKVLALAPPEE